MHIALEISFPRSSWPQTILSASLVSECIPSQSIITLTNATQSTIAIEHGKQKETKDAHLKAMWRSCSGTGAKESVRNVTLCGE